MELRWHQKQIIEDDYDRIIVRHGRRCGITWAIAKKVIDTALANNDSKQLIMLPHNTQINQYIKLFKELSPKKYLKVATKEGCRFTNGSTLWFLTSNSSDFIIPGRQYDNVYVDCAEGFEVKALKKFLSYCSGWMNLKILLSYTTTKRSMSLDYLAQGKCKTKGWSTHYYWPGMSSTTGKVNPDWTINFDEDLLIELGEEFYNLEVKAEYYKKGND